MKKNDADGQRTVVDESTPISYDSVERPTYLSVAPSRETIGYVTSGRFLLSHACGAGVGFITCDSLKRMCQLQVKHQRIRDFLSHSTDFQDGSLLALVRSCDSKQYRFVKLKLVKPW